MKKKCLSVALCMSLCLCALIPVNAESSPSLNSLIYNDHGNIINGVLPTDVSVYESHLNKSPIPYATVAPSVDLSTSIYFPAINDQGDLNACTAFSTTYYQFSFEKNKLLKTPSSGADTWASPRLTYTFCNHGLNTGISVRDAYQFLEHFGDLSWTDFPYIGTNLPEYYRTWPTDTDELRDALSVRLSSWEAYEISSGSNMASGLNKVKSVLQSGKVLQMSLYSSDWYIMRSDEYGKILCRNGRLNNSSSSHSVAVVGYNDNVCIDVNGNGKIDAGEKGAFKIANSWGTNDYYTNNGYLWILYDTLNMTSTIPGNWQSQFSSVRCPLASIDDEGYPTSSNYFTAITVAQYPVYMVAEVTYTSDSREAIWCSSTKDDNTNNKIEPFLPSTGTSMNGEHYPVAGTYTAMYDLSPLMKSIETDFTDTDWNTKIETRDLGKYSITNISYRITDSFGRAVTSTHTRSLLNQQNQSITFRDNVDLIIGDVDYSGTITSSDALTVLQAATKKVKLSSLQTFLGDYDRDGSITSNDAQQILQNATGG